MEFQWASTRGFIEINPNHKDYSKEAYYIIKIMSKNAIAADSQNFDAFSYTLLMTTNQVFLSISMYIKINI